jgi:16S rRNA G1207 methylase RsmC
MDGIAIMQHVYARKVLDKAHLDLTNQDRAGLPRLPLCFAEDERERIVKRANEGRQAAKMAGAKFGRPRKLNETQLARARELLRLGGKLRDVAQEMNVHRSTISRLR